MPRGRPVDPETRAQAERLMAEGKLGRNAIARELGIAAAVVTGIAQDIGHEFDWKQTELAVRARVIETADIRVGLAHAALLRAHEALEAMDAPTLVVHYQAKTKRDAGGWKEHTLPAPPIADQRNLATIFGILVQRAAELGKSAAGQANSDAVSQIETLAAGLQFAAAMMRDEADDPTATPTMVSREALLAEFEASVGDQVDDETQENDDA